MREYIIGFIGIMIIIGIPYSIITYQSNNRKEIEQNGILTYCIITNDSRVKANFTINGKPYQSLRLSSPYNGIQNGEMFEMKYKKSDTTDVIIYYKKPVIIDSLFQTTSNYKLTYVGDDDVTFIYNVEGKSNERIQLFTKEDIKKLKDNASFVVKYKKNNYKIAYLTPLNRSHL